MRCSCSNRRRMLLVHKSRHVGVRVYRKAETCKLHKRAKFSFMKLPRLARKKNRQNQGSARATQVDCMFGLSSFSTASRIKCIKYKNETKSLASDVAAATSNSNNTSTYVQFAALSALLIWRPPPRVQATSPIPLRYPVPNSQYPIHCHSHIHIHILYTFTSRAGGAPAANCFAIMRFCASSASLRGQRHEVMLNKPGADLKNIKNILGDIKVLRNKSKHECFQTNIRH